MNTLLKQKREFEKKFGEKSSFSDWLTKENTKVVWKWIEKAIKEAREEGYKEGFIKGWNLTKGELPNTKQRHKQGFIDGWNARMEAEKKEKVIDEYISEGI